VDAHGLRRERISEKAQKVHEVNIIVLSIVRDRLDCKHYAKIDTRETPDSCLGGSLSMLERVLNVATIPSPPSALSRAQYT